MPEPPSDAIIRQLNHCLTLSYYSTAAYILGSTPYLTDNDKDAVKLLKEMAGADSETTDAITRHIGDLGGVPLAGLPDPMHAELNYLSFPFLLDAIERTKKREIAVFEAALKACEAAGEETKERLGSTLEAHKAFLEKIGQVREKRYKKPEPKPEPKPDSGPSE